MAWNEVTALRRQRSRTYQDDVDGSKRSLDATLATLHYSSALDSGVYDAEIDMSLQRVDVPQFDGWRISQNSWHYALGQPEGKSDGWVGFGGRQGAHWFQFRLLRAGYLHWSTRAWDDIGGAPTYDRANLTRETGTITLATKGDTINVASTATWTGLWPTPGGGDVSARWVAYGTGLKEEIVVNEAGRDWIAINRPPTTPLAETYFGFVFQLDWSDIPKVMRADVQQSVDADFADDGEEIELTDALDRLLAYMPLSEVYVNQGFPLSRANQPLRKRFYADSGNYYLLVGVRCDLLNSLPDGDLVFDPTIEEAVDASGDDGFVQDASGFDSSGDAMHMGWYDAVFENAHIWMRFDDVSGFGGGNTIDVAYCKMWNSTNYGQPELIIYGDDDGTPAAPTSHAEYDALTTTSESVQWDFDTYPANDQTPSIVDIIQELSNSYDPSAVQILIKNDGVSSGEHLQSLNTWDLADNSQAPIIHIEYTAAAAGVDMPAIAMHHYRLRRAA